MCLCTLMHTWHAHTRDSWLTQMQRGINVRDQLHGLNLAFSGCGLTPHAVCVTVSHGKNCSAAELCARGWCCRSRMCFQWWGLAMHVDMLREILSTLCPRHLMSVRSIESQWPHTHILYTHTVKPKFFLCVTLQYSIFWWDPKNLYKTFFIYALLFHMFFSFSLPTVFFLSFLLSTFSGTIFLASNGIRESLNHGDQTSWNNYN